MSNLLIKIKHMRSSFEQPTSAVENAREQIKLLLEEYTQLCQTGARTDAARGRMDAINNEMIPHFATLDAANEKLVN